MGNKASAVLRVFKAADDNGHRVTPSEPPQYPQYPTNSPLPTEWPQHTPSTDYTPTPAPKEYARPGMAEAFSAVLPRPLNAGDKIGIAGSIADNASEFTINLLTGSSGPDTSNIAYQFRVDFDNNKIFIGYVKDGQYINTEHDIVFERGGEWNVTLTVLEQEIIAHTDGVYHSDLELQHDFGSIRFVQVTGHIQQVKTLSFEFA